MLKLNVLSCLLSVAIFYAGYSNAVVDEDYLGVFIGNMTQLRFKHIITGEVYAVNAKTIYFKDFFYSGAAPALYFYATTKDKPDGTGFRIKDSEYDGHPMRRYSQEGVILSLPDGVTFADVKHIYVWCEKFKVYCTLGPNDRFVSFDVESLYTNVTIKESLQIIRQRLSDDDTLHERTNLPLEGVMELLECRVHNFYFQINFGGVELGDNFVDYPKPQRIGALKGPHGVSSDPIIFLDTQSMLIPNFFYDGKSPNARFWLTPRGQGLSPNGIVVPDENNSTYPLKKYNGKSIILRLPEINFELGSFGVWDKDFIASFAQIQIPRLDNLPPAVSHLKLSPWKECANCEEAKANFKISQVPTLTSFETNVNTLERDYMTINARVPAEYPKTYYETPVYKAQNNNGDRRVNSIRDTSSQGCLASVQGKLFYLVPYRGSQEL